MNCYLSLYSVPRRLFAAILASASIGILAACNGVGIDLANRYDSIATGDARSTVIAKMSGEPVSRESATLLGLSYERLEYVDVRNRYALVLIAGVTAAKFSQPRY